MNKELFDKYGVKDLKDKNGQSECHYCKNIKHKYSLTWTSFLYEYKEEYYCFDCLLTILLRQENQQLKQQATNYIEMVQDLREWLELRWSQTQDVWYVKVINKLNELEGGIYEN